MHNFNKWKPNLKKIPKATAYVASRHDEAAWSDASRERAIVKFLTGVDYLPAAQAVIERPTQVVESTDGAKATARQNIVFRGEPTTSTTGRAGAVNGTRSGGGAVRGAVIGSVASLSSSEQEMRRAVQELIAAGSGGTLDAMMRAYAGELADVFLDA